MPSLYAHYRFGTLILPQLPGDIRGTIMRHRKLFDAGLQGPDFFFYYKPTADTPVRQIGRDIHHQSGRDYFTRVCRGLRIDSDEAVLAYLYGLLGHYCLDSLFHPLIHRLSGGDNLLHNELESEFERHLLFRDGVKAPCAYCRSSLVQLTRDQCHRIRIFYPPATGDEIYEALRSMRRVTGLLTGSGSIYRAAAKAVLRTLGREKTGLLMPNRPDPHWAGVDSQLAALYDRALDLYPVLLDQLRDHLTFREPLGPDFDPLFD